jgi:XTP/dITP diphosphohydrolase
MPRTTRAQRRAPGVRSARYAEDFGQPKGDASNNRVLIEQLERVSETAERTARFVCALVAVRSAEDPQPLVALGRWPGVILTEPRGDAGFGYDPLMFIPELQCSVAELSAADKNARSHRGLASRDMLQQMREVWRLG